MKTFKVAAFFLEKQGELLPIPIQDGLIINREDEQQSWLIELFLDEKEEQSIRPFEGKEQVQARVAITHRGNDPALFDVAIRSFQPLEKGVSVLLDAQLRQMRNEYAKQVLHSLVEQGLEGDELLDTFTRVLRKRPNVPEPSEKK